MLTFPPLTPSNVGQHAILGLSADHYGVYVCGCGMRCEHETRKERGVCWNSTYLPDLC